MSLQDCVTASVSGGMGSVAIDSRGCLSLPVGPIRGPARGVLGGRRGG